jgi:hypothetical protein
MELLLLLIGLAAAVSNPNTPNPSTNILLQFIKPDTYCDADLKNANLRDFYNGVNTPCTGTGV